MDGYAVLDFETTGFVPERSDRVVEVGVVLTDMNGRPQDSWSTLINPKRDIGATHIHGISGADLLDAPEFCDISDDLLGLVSGRALVAHNAPFDTRFFYQELLRAGYEMSAQPAAICSMKWSGRLLGAVKLEHCCEALGIPLDNAHSALADASATAELLAQLIKFTQKNDSWLNELNNARNYQWPAIQGTTPHKTVTRSIGRDRQGSWIHNLVSRTWVPANPNNEAEYLLELEKSLLDFNISATEARALVDTAKRTNVSKDRAMELHLAHLGRLAAEAWSDGVITESERTELLNAAECMGLSGADVDHALDDHENELHRAKPSGPLLEEGDRIVFTGTLQRPRELWIEEVVAAGLATGGITKSTKLLVAADPDSLSGKASKARKYGVPVVSEQAFAKYFEEYLEYDKPLIF